MKKLVTLLALLAAVGTLVVGVAGAADDDAPTYTNKQVMKMAHKDGLLKKVLSEKASEDESAKLLELYKAMAKNKPKKGDADSWKKKTAAIVKACEAGDLAALKKATNCGSCHKAHK